MPAANFLRLSALLIAVLGPALLTGADPPRTGTIEGVVRFTGKVPEPTRITTADGGAIFHSDLVVDAKSKGLRDVTVYLEDAPAQPKVEKAKPALIDQRDMLFIPRVVAVQHGQPVRFDNSDSCNHSVMGVSTVKANQFNIFVGPAEPLTTTFEYQKRPVMIGCSLHGWMRAWVYVVQHPWFAVSDAQGKFAMKDVPAGKYTLLLHHADTGLQEQRKVEVVPGKPASVMVDWEKTK